MAARRGHKHDVATLSLVSQFTQSEALPDSKGHIARFSLTAAAPIRSLEFQVALQTAEMGLRLLKVCNIVLMQIRADQAKH
jgi:hypothetical protein